jgi:CubicO group peptidase (beta-lactamase class C family)
MGLLIKNYLKKDLVNEAEKYFFQPLKMGHTTFKPKELIGADVVPTEEDGWRPGLVHKEVHDEVTWKLQQEFFPGIAGLFSTTKDINKFLKMLLDNGQAGGKKYFEPETIKLMSEKQFSGQEKLSPFGWEPGQKSASSSLESRPLLFGKTGFTGCFVDVDLESEIAIVFLSNRIYPKRPTTKDDFIKIREQICEIVFGK